MEKAELLNKDPAICSIYVAIGSVFKLLDSYEMFHSHSELSELLTNQNGQQCVPSVKDPAG